MENDLTYRSQFLLEVLDYWQIPKDSSILEVGAGDWRNVNYLKEHGYENVEGIDKIHGTAIEDIEPKQYDLIFSMSCFFLIPPEKNWVFEKIASMAKTWLITIEGEVHRGSDLFGREYNEVFGKFGFNQLEHMTDVFNEYGVLRVLKRNGTA